MVLILNNLRCVWRFTSASLQPHAGACLFGGRPAAMLWLQYPEMKDFGNSRNTGLDVGACKHSWASNASTVFYFFKKKRKRGGKRSFGSSCCESHYGCKCVLCQWRRKPGESLNSKTASLVLRCLQSLRMIITSSSWWQEKMGQRAGELVAVHTHAEQHAGISTGTKPWYSLELHALSPLTSVCHLAIAK